ncbi:MAG: anion permease [Melioribacteraceae bacterium]|nr:anion permease [Melioribacteraceae bacterium]
MSFEFYYTLVLFLLLTILLVKEIVKPEIAIFSILMLLVVGNVITVKEAFSGFSNEGMLTIGLLFVVAGSLQTTGVMEKFIKIILGGAQGTLSKKLAVILFPVTILSSILNNTPIVAMLIPGIKSWGERNNISPSKLLMPLSYAAILGGMCTLIGTSTNLIVHGLLIENGLQGFGFFELSVIGIPAAILGFFYMIFFAPKSLPDKLSITYNLIGKTREFVIELKVTEQYPGLNKSIEDAGLRHLKGLYLFQIERNKSIINPARPTEIVQNNDRLFFTGLPKTIIELQKTPGLELLKNEEFDLKNYDSDQIKTYEAVISPNSSLSGVKVKDSNFRAHFNAVILAIHRNGERIDKKIGDVVLKIGDTILLLADKSFKQKWYHSTEFSLISESEEVHSKPIWHSYFSILVFLVMITLSVLDILPLITAMGIAAVILVLFGSISGSNAINSIDWKVLLIIASSFGIAIGLEKSGVGNFFANLVITISKPLGQIGILTAVYLITTIYTNFITNNTAAVLMFPLALSAATILNIDVHLFAIAIAIGASSSFLTPISYQTNLMVYGAGGYKFKDFIKFGFPLQIILLAVTLTYFTIVL